MAMYMYAEVISAGVVMNAERNGALVKMDGVSQMMSQMKLQQLVDSINAVLLEGNCEFKAAYLTLRNLYAEDREFTAYYKAMCTADSSHVESTRASLKVIKAHALSEISELKQLASMAIAGF